MLNVSGVLLSTYQIKIQDRVATLDQDKIPCVFPVFFAFSLCFHRQKKKIIVCKWPPPPLQQSFPPFLLQIKLLHVKMTLD